MLKRIGKAAPAIVALLLAPVLATGAERYPLAQYLSIRSASGPSLSPDGANLAFLTNVTGVTQGWMVDSKGGWPNQVTFTQDRIGFLTFGPKGDRLFYSMSVGGSERTQIYSVALDGTDLVRHTKKDDVIYNYGGLSHDGTRLAFSSNERDQTYFDVYVMDLATGEVKLLHQSDNSNAAAGWSQDDRWIVMSRSNTNLDNDLFLLPATGGDPVLVTPHKGEAEFAGVAWPKGENGFYLISNKDREYANLAWYDVAKKELKFLEERPSDLEAIEISGDGRYLARVDDADGFAPITILDRKTGKSGSVPGLPKGLATSLNFADNRDLLAFGYLNYSRPADIWTYDLETGAVTQVTHSALAGIPAASFVEGELVSYKSFDGKQIPGFLYLPKEAKKDGTVSVIINIHGGPEGQSRPAFSGFNQYFLSRGYGIFEPNIRGSTGYGKAFTHLDDIAKRGDSIQDVVEAAHYLKDSGYADPRKVIVMGGSYGGYMTLAAVSMHPDDFAAGVDIVGIANFESFLKNTGSWRVRFREVEYGSLTKDLETLRKFSPIHYADQIKAPLFVIQGANDPRVPQSEAEQIVDSIKKRNGVVEYMLFPDEGHGLAKLANRIKAYTAVADFLDKHVQGGS